MTEHSEALRFTTPLDAAIYSQLLKLGGRVVTIDGTGQQVDEFVVEAILSQARIEAAASAALQRRAAGHR